MRSSGWSLPSPEAKRRTGRKSNRIVIVATATARIALAACAPPQTTNPMGYLGEYPSARIVDGDTIDVTSLPSDNIRFIGSDTPEVWPISDGRLRARAH